MKNKIVSYYSNEETGVCRMTIQNKYGKFTGYAYCSEDDLENFSSHAGLRYAENRAAAEYAKLRLKQEKIKLKTIQNLVKDFEYNNTPIPREIKIKLRDYNQSTSDWENLYFYLLDSVKKQDQERQRVLSWSKKDN